ncbi:MAG: RsmE family RNA methyltransferase [Kiritimatiellia bacterium]
MHCILLKTDFPTAGTGVFSLQAEAAHHLRDVLRAKRGDAVRLVNGNGLARDAHVSSLSHREVLLEPDGTILELPPPPAFITLFQCVAKPSRMDWLLEKVAELGAAQLRPVLSARTVAHLKKGDRPERWQRILDAALCQCNAAWETALEPAVDWKQTIELMRDFPGPVFVGAIAPNAAPIAQALQNKPVPYGSKAALLIGPEGDFSPDELAEAIALPNAIPVSLGNRILRVETAAVYALANLLAAAQLP